MRQLFVLTSLILLLTGCSLNTSNNSFSLNEIKLGDSYEEVINIFGEPTLKKDENNIITIIYGKLGSGIVIKFVNKEVNQVEIYPDYLNKEWIKSVPFNKDNVIDLYGKSEEIIEKSCYESAYCEEWSYYNENERLIVLFRWDNETVDRITLLNK